MADRLSLSVLRSGHARPGAGHNLIVWCGGRSRARTADLLLVRQ